jgi:hypothetical protein
MSTQAHALPANEAPAVARPRDGLLRGALRVDAVASVASGLAYLVAAGPIGDLLGLPAGFLRVIGAFSVVYAAFAWFTAARPRVPLGTSRFIAIGNLVWFAASVALVLADWHSPTTTGSVWIVMQGVMVAGFADAQLLGVRRASSR